MATSEGLKGYQRSYLMRLSHELKPVVMVGKGGLSAGLVATTDTALEDHELIKVKFVDFKEERHEVAEQLAEATGATLVRVIGNIAVLYRHQEDPDKRWVHLPK
jgi:RNA-binding protein